MISNFARRAAGRMGLKLESNANSRISTGWASVGMKQYHSLTKTLLTRPQKRANAVFLGGKSRVQAILSTKYQPSRFMVQARKFSENASEAAGKAQGGIFAFPKKHPFATNIIVATIKTSICDMLVQKYVEGKKEIDWLRVSVFTAFGCLYLGFFQWFLYVTLYARMFKGMAKFANKPIREKLKDRRGMLNVVGQTLVDNFVHYSFIYYPVFYTFKEAIQGTGYEKTVSSVVGTSLGKYRENIVEDNLKMWALWIPGDMIIYAVPMWMRLPLNHGLSFVWTCYLSFLRGDKIVEDDEEGGNDAGAVQVVALSDEEAAAVDPKTLVEAKVE